MSQYDDTSRDIPTALLKLALQLDVATFSYELSDDRLVFQSDEKVILLDTSMSCSISNTSEFHFLNHTFPTRQDYQGKKLDSFSMCVGRFVDVVLGMDIIQQFDMKISSLHQQIRFDTQEMQLEGEMFQLRSAHGLPIIENISVDNLALPMHFNTGARLSFLRQEYLSSLVSEGTEKNWHPLNSVFCSDAFCHFSDTYTLPVTLAGSSVSMIFGDNYPLFQQAEDTETLDFRQLLLELKKLALDFDGVLGTEMLKYYDIILAMRRQKLCFIKHQ